LRFGCRPWGQGSERQMQVLVIMMGALTIAYATAILLWVLIP
jgi:hypothetical protein